MKNRRALAKLFTAGAFVVLFMFCLIFLIALAGGVALASPTGIYWMFLIPFPLYIFAIGSFFWTLRAVAKGDRFPPLIDRLLARVGWSLFIAGLLVVFGIPLTMKLMTGQGGYAYFDPASMTLGVVGAGLASVSHLLGRAIDAERELDEFI